MKALLERIARGLVDEPARVRVEEWKEDGMVHFDVEVAESDRGRVIGRQGRTAAALRTLLSSVADDRRVSLDIRDTQGGR